MIGNVWNIDVRSEANDRCEPCDDTTLPGCNNNYEFFFVFSLNLDKDRSALDLRVRSVLGEKVSPFVKVRGSGKARFGRTTCKYNGRCGMRRLARRRNILAAFFAIMGRLGKGSQSATRPIFRVHYRKLVDEYSQQEQLRFMPALPDYMSYCCCRCGHTQKLKVSSIRASCEFRS